MIGFLRGKVAVIHAGRVIIEVNGIGYQVQMPFSQLDRLPGPGEPLLVHTHLVHKDDSIYLYGFLEERALDIFRMLLGVSGVGPRLALNILSTVPVDELLASISAGDASRLKAVHGVGKKTAARICVDLKEKAAKYISVMGEPAGEAPAGSRCIADQKVLEDAVSALSNLGYRSSEARKAVMDVTEKGGGPDCLDSIIKKALRKLCRA